MNEIKKQNIFHRIIDLIIIALLIFAPGIRGYQNWYWYEYLLFVFIPVVWLIYDFIQRTINK